MGTAGKMRTRTRFVVVLTARKASQLKKKEDFNIIVAKVSNS